MEKDERRHVFSISAEELHWELVEASINRHGGMAPKANVTLEDCQTALEHLSRHAAPATREIYRDIRLGELEAMRRCYD